MKRLKGERGGGKILCLRMHERVMGFKLCSGETPVPFHNLENDASDQDGATTTATTAGESVRRKSPVALLQGFMNSYLGRLFYPDDVHLLPEVDLQGVSWHPNKHIIAFISAPTQVLVRDYQESEGKDPSILTNESQRDARVLEWRPNGGKMLAVGCKGGICMWAASYPGNAASVRSGAASFLGASASYESSSFSVWDFAQGVGTPIRRGLGGISMLKWSPTGDYFFASKFDGTFYLWETNTWTSEQWSSTSGFVKGATWDPDGRMILLAFSESSTLGSIHFASKPPSLDAHLLPVDLPEILSLTGSQGIEKIAWDNSGERLAVSFKGGEDIYRGLIAVYDTRRTPLISTSLIAGAAGFVALIPSYFALICFHKKDFCEILMFVYDWGEQVDFDVNVIYSIFFGLLYGLLYHQNRMVTGF
ncbi:hypothetical protein JHK85_007477 [Glycine max]|nr:hypothetical protein JHK85_007477 [Glycine max]